MWHPPPPLESWEHWEHSTELSGWRPTKPLFNIPNLSIPSMQKLNKWNPTSRMSWTTHSCCAPTGPAQTGQRKGRCHHHGNSPRSQNALGVGTIWRWPSGAFCCTRRVAGCWRGGPWASWNEDLLQQQQKVKKIETFYLAFWIHLSSLSNGTESPIGSRLSMTIVTMSISRFAFIHDYNFQVVGREG